MEWLLVFKFNFPDNVKSYSESYPESNQRLMNFYYENGLISAMPVLKDGKSLTYVVWKSKEIYDNVCILQVDNPDYIARKQYNDDNNIVQEILYQGLQSEFDPNSI